MDEKLEIVRWEDTILDPNDERRICPDCGKETSIELGDFEYSVVCTHCGYDEGMLDK